MVVTLIIYKGCCAWAKVAIVGKLFFDADLIRSGQAKPIELYDLEVDPKEKNNLLQNTDFAPAVVKMLTEAALLARNTGGHNLAPFAPSETFVFDWRAAADAEALAALRPHISSELHEQLAAQLRDTPPPEAP